MKRTVKVKPLIELLLTAVDISLGWHAYWTFLALHGSPILMSELHGFWYDAYTERSTRQELPFPRNPTLGTFNI